MITFEEVRKDITTVDEGIVLHGCNCQGVMGSGVAKAIRAKWPEAYQDYKRHVDAMGSDNLLGTTSKVQVEPGLWVYNGLTQVYYGRDEAVYASLYAIFTVVNEAIDDALGMSVDNLWLPQIGCGLGGLDYEKGVRPIIAQAVDIWSRDSYVGKLHPSTDLTITVCTL